MEIDRIRKTLQDIAVTSASKDAVPRLVSIVLELANAVEELQRRGPTRSDYV
jgi:hypothetical protein